MTYLVHNLHSPPIKAGGDRDIHLAGIPLLHRAATKAEAEIWQFGEIKRRLMLRAGEISQEFATQVSQWLDDGRPPQAVQADIEGMRWP